MTKIGGRDVDDTALQRYINHIENRLRGQDHRDVEVREQERHVLHDAVTKSAGLDPENDVDIDFNDALQAFVTKEVGIYDPTMVGQ